MPVARHFANRLGLMRYHKVVAPQRRCGGGFAAAAAANDNDIPVETFNLRVVFHGAYLTCRLSAGKCFT